MPIPLRCPSQLSTDDLDGTIMNYEITHVIDRSNRQALSMQQLLEMIREAGRVPVERDGLYNILSRWQVESPLEALPPLN